jgi:hypothetical protein
MKRRRSTVITLIGASALALSVTSIGHGQPSRNTVYIAPNISRTVTISRSGVVWTTLAIPQGTAIGVTYDTARSVLPSGDGRFVFHGNVEIRALAISQKDPTQRFQQAVSESPLELTAMGVDVEIVPDGK